MKNLIFFALIFFSFSNVRAGAQEPICKKAYNDLKSPGSAAEKFHRYLKDQWAYLMHESPEWATSLGYPGQNDRLSDVSIEAIQRRAYEVKCQLDVLNSFDRKSLKGEDLISYDFVVYNLKMADEGNKFDGVYLAISHMDGPHIDLPDLIINMPHANKKDYENILSRFEKVPAYLKQIEALLREGVKRKATQVRMFIERVPGQIDRIMPAKVEDSPFYKPFAEISANLTEDDKAVLRNRAKATIEKTLYPAFSDLKKFMREEYILHARESTSYFEMPNGKAWYDYLVRFHTTTNTNAQSLHDLGLREVARISAEMTKIREQLHFKGSREDFSKFLNSNDRFFFSNEDDLLREFRSIGKEVDAELPRFFERLPRLPYGVRPMPVYKANEAPAAYYIGGTLEAGRAGFFEANTSNLRSRPKWGLRCLTMHEAVPGHHLQIAIAQELDNLPDIRRNSGLTAYVEGWGLYAESLHREMGFDKDPYSNYGCLGYEIWRAVRLVVDTGVHALGWSREKAIAYYLENTPQTRKEAEVEVDRYITWPGQALAYKVGQLKFLELREKAKEKLGDKFDIRKFHDAMLTHGALPMTMLKAAGVD